MQDEHSEQDEQHVFFQVDLGGIHETQGVNPHMKLQPHHNPPTALGVRRAAVSAHPDARWRHSTTSAPTAMFTSM